jgi:hypothetical protein
VPIRDDSGKELSGSARRKRRKQATAEQQALQSEISDQPDAGGLKFSDLPTPPLRNPLKAMGWWNDMLLVCADNVLRAPASMPLEKRVRLLADFAAKAGMIRDKAAETKAIRKALKAGDKKKEAAGLEHASGPAPSKIPRPPG